MARGNLASSSTILALAIGTFALFLGLRLWYERKRRVASEADQAFFRFQDVRRLLGLAAMAGAAIGIAYGGQVGARAGGRPNPAFAIAWLAVGLCVILMLGFAIIDWMATWRFERRARRRLVRERVEILRDILAATHGAQGSAGSDDENLDPDQETL